MTTSDRLKAIADTAQEIRERALAIPMGDDVPYSVDVALSVINAELRSVLDDLNDLTEDDTRNPPIPSNQ